MDFYNYRCPVCEKAFEKDSDIVVCPECGAPHHRECYEELDHCFFEDKHKDGFDYKAEFKSENKTDSAQNAQVFSTDIISCANCGTFNVASNESCTNCGAPLEKRKSTYTTYDRHAEEGTTPPPNYAGAENGQPFSGFPYDAMGGLKSDSDLGNGVTAGEVAKFTKNSSPFFTRLFHQIKVFGRSRFSFVGFIFHGGWLLYRKMYKLGAFITALMAVFMISQMVVATYYQDLLNELTKATENLTFFGNTASTENLNAFIASLDMEETIAMMIYSFSSIGQLALRIICGVCGNRWYYKHCIKNISKIKNTAGSKEAADTALQTKGGVNNPIAVSLIITYAILNFLPSFF